MTALIASIAGVLSSVLAIVLIYLKRKHGKSEEKIKLTEDAQKMFHEGMAKSDDTLIRRALDRIRRMRQK